MAASKVHVHAEHAEKILKALPAKVREAAEVIKGGGEYQILKIHGKSVASVRDKNVRIVHPTDGSADSLKALAKLIADAAPEPAPAKPTAEEKAAAKAEKEAAKEAAAASAKDGEGK
jgi:hypothetical protein